VIYNPVSGSSASIRNVQTSTNIAVSASYSSGEQSFDIQFVNGGISMSDFISLHWTNDTELY